MFVPSHSVQIIYTKLTELILVDAGVNGVPLVDKTSFVMSFTASEILNLRKYTVV
jgi:hypothetical protein